VLGDLKNLIWSKLGCHCEKIWTEYRWEYDQEYPLEYDQESPLEYPVEYTFGHDLECV